MIGGCARAAPGGTSRPEFTKSDIERVLEQLLLERDASPHPGGRLRRGLPGGALTRTRKETLFTLLRRRLGLAVDTLVMVRIDREPGSASALLPFIAEPPDRDPARDFVALVVRPGAAFGQHVCYTVMKRPERWASGRYQLDGKDIGSRTNSRPKPPG